MQVIDFINSKITGDPLLDRTSWQWKCIKTWSERGYRATVEACTGSGKSRIGLHTIQLLRRTDVTRTVLVVVPTLQLQIQWRKELKKWKLNKFTDVMVINTAAKQDRKYDLMIVDEIHGAAAHTFSLLFENTKYSFVLGLTATLSRLDGRHSILEQFAPICEKLSMAQARQRGWVADFVEYWIGLTLNEQDQAEYEEIQSQFRKFLKYFGMDLNTCKKAMGSAPLRAHIASRNGIDSETVKIYAINAMRYIRMTMKFVYNHESKIDAAKQLIETLGRKTLTFGESIEVANKLSSRLGPTSMAFHSEMEPLIKDTFKDKKFKTEAGARRHIAKQLELNADAQVSYKFKHGKHIAQYKVIKRITGQKLKEYALHKIANTLQLMTITTAKALSEGFDFPGAQLGVSLSRSSSPTKYIQETGRVCRLDESSDVRPIMVHIYLKNTKDQYWLQSAGFGAIGAIKLNSIDELLNHLNTA